MDAGTCSLFDWLRARTRRPLRALNQSRKFSPKYTFLTASL